MLRSKIFINFIIMDIQSEKIELVKQILNTDDKALLQAVQSVLTNYSDDSDFWDDLTQQTQQEITEAMEQADTGRTVSHDEAVKRFSQWGLK